MNNKLGLVLRVLLVLLIGATSLMTLLGAVGTVCLAFNGTLYPAYRWIIPLMPTFQILVYIKIAVGFALALVTYATARGDRWFYLGALIFLVAGLSAAAYQMVLSSTARHIPFLAVAPTNIRFYITSVTLLAFLIIRFPGIWNKGGLGIPGGGKGNLALPGGLAMIVTGLMMITAPWWASPEHVVDGVNYVLTLQVPLIVDGIALMFGGASVLLAPRLFAWWQTRRALVSES
ncbi:MAG: hypothetical protein HY868_25700 [Chloroflexi bacterium]|nr:hypothetical protein [Chloroflexota bacterium]